MHNTRRESCCGGCWFLAVIWHFTLKIHHTRPAVMLDLQSWGTGISLGPGTKSWSRASLSERTKRSRGTRTQTLIYMSNVNTQCEALKRECSMWIKKRKKERNKQTSARARANLLVQRRWRERGSVEPAHQIMTLWGNSAAGLAGGGERVRGEVVVNCSIVVVNPL